jgi:restriction system protein
MAVPTYDRFVEPLLRFLAARPEGVSAREAQDGAAAALGLTELDRQVLLPSGTQLMYRNRAGWANDRLKRAGLSTSPKRGLWLATSKGKDLVAAHPDSFPDRMVDDLTTVPVLVRSESDHSTALEAQPVPSPISITSSRNASPDDRLSEAILEIRQSAEAELLELVAHVSPSYFETIVLDLLHRMGYGASRTDLKRVGGTGDGGIDGVISLDRLGLEKVYVQAKRWQGNVGRPELQAFYGALAGQKAKKGVFITTSAYTSQAIDFAKSVEGIVLIDGQQLTRLMIEYELGVTARTLKIPKIDGDYFDEEST